MKPTRKLRALFYGVTHEHAYGKFRSLRRLADDYELVAVVDDRPRGTLHFLDERLDVDAVRRAGIPVISEADAHERHDIDVVFVETANADLMAVASRYAARGTAMHCDKPCGEELEPYRTILAECRAKNLPFQIGYMYRGNPALQWIWRQVGAGAIGEVRYVEADMVHNYQQDNYAQFIGSFRGGIFHNLGCHLVDMVYPLVGGAPVEAAGSRIEGTRALAYFRFGGGAEAVLRASAGLAGGILARRLRIDGTKGTLDLSPIERFDGRELTVRLVADGREQVRSFGVQTDRYAPQLRELAAIVRGDCPNAQDYDRDWWVHATTHQACRSPLRI
ncbi:MAG: Gfo/Idh/MocA family protein [Kiritimatiellia bacterium]